jgi:exodeoxyribonuclease VII small subunit
VDRPRGPKDARWPIPAAKEGVGCPIRPAERLFENPALNRHLPSPVEIKESKLSFETALEKLEVIVESMESGDVALADLLAKFEEGNELLTLCEARLKSAELKIEQLKKDREGETLSAFATERANG